MKIFSSDFICVYLRSSASHIILFLCSSAVLYALWFESFFRRERWLFGNR
jgi:hypothetical protein